VNISKILRVRPTSWASCAVAGAAVVVSTLASPGTPASAQTQATPGSVKLCRDSLFRDCGVFSLPDRGVPVNLTGLATQESGLSLQDTVSSLSNNSASVLCFYVDANGGGLKLSVAGPRSYSDLSRDISGNDWNDVITSFKVC
jgi:hypothetical protein